MYSSWRDGVYDSLNNRELADTSVGGVEATHGVPVDTRGTLVRKNDTRTKGSDVVLK